MKNTVRAVSQSPAASPTARSGRAIIAIVGVVVVAVVAVSAMQLMRSTETREVGDASTADHTAATPAAQPGRRSLADPATPPAPALDELEPALARRITELTDQIKAASDDAPAWGTLGIVFDVHDMQAEAIICYQYAIELDPDEFQWPYFLGHCHRIGDQTQALEAFASAAAIDDAYAPLQVYLGHGYLALDDLAKARVHYERAIELDPKLPRAIVGLAQLAIAEGNANVAVQGLNQLVLRRENSAEVFHLLAKASQMLGDDDVAQHYTEKADDFPPLEPLVDPRRDDVGYQHGVTLNWRRHRAERHLANNRVDKAIAEWEQAVEDNPQSSVAHAQVGLLYSGTGRFEEAVTAFERALELDQRAHDVRNNLGGLLIKAGETERGLQHLRDACRFLPDSADAHFNLGQALQTTGNAEEAVDAYRTAFELEPNHALARLEYATTLGRLNRTEEAIDAFNALIEHEPGLGLAYTKLAVVYGLAGQEGMVIDTLRRGRAQMPDNLEISARLAWRLATSVDPKFVDGDEALTIAQELCTKTNYDHPLMLDALAAAYAAVGNYDEAVHQAERAVRLIGERPGNDPQRTSELIANIQARVDLYRNGKPYRAD